MPAHGSVRRRAARRSAVSIVNAPGASILPSSSQRSGIATVARSRARSDQPATMLYVLVGGDRSRV